MIVPCSCLYKVTARGISLFSVFTLGNEKGNGLNLWQGKLATGIFSCYVMLVKNWNKLPFWFLESLNVLQKKQGKIFTDAEYLF